MAIREIVLEGDQALGKICRPVTDFNHRLSVLLDDMFDTMYEANGAGLAAPQIGIVKRIVVIDVDGEHPLELINPEIIEREGDQREIEGCLSLPNVWGYTHRPAKVKVRAQDRKGEWHEYEGEGLLARAFCHELDHVDGVLFRERVDEYVTLKTEDEED